MVVIWALVPRLGESPDGEELGPHNNYEALAKSAKVYEGHFGHLA